jgi:hypothetical protein
MMELAVLQYPYMSIFATKPLPYTEEAIYLLQYPYNESTSSSVEVLYNRYGKDLQYPYRGELCSQVAVIPNEHTCSSNTHIRVTVPKEG